MLYLPRPPRRHLPGRWNQTRVAGVAESRTSTSRRTCAPLTVSLPRPHGLPRSKRPRASRSAGPTTARPRHAPSLVPPSASQPSWRRCVTSGCFERVGRRRRVVSWARGFWPPVPRRPLPAPRDPVVAARGTAPHDRRAIDLERRDDRAGTAPASRAPPTGHVRPGVRRRSAARHPRHDRAEEQAKVQCRPGDTLGDRARNVQEVPHVGHPRAADRTSHHASPFPLSLVAPYAWPGSIVPPGQASGASDHSPSSRGASDGDARAPAARARHPRRVPAGTRPTGYARHTPSRHRTAWPERS